MVSDEFSGLEASLRFVLDKLAPLDEHNSQGNDVVTIAQYRAIVRTVVEVLKTLHASAGNTIVHVN